MNPSSEGERGPPSSTEVKLGSHEYGHNLWADLEEALKGDLEFKGDFCHVEYDYYAPNPGLRIAGLGQMGIPISASDARSLTGYASAYMAHSLENETRSQVREITEDRVEFKNPKWQTFIESTIVKVCKALGVGQHIGTVTCYRQKLLIPDSGPLTHGLKSKSQEIGSFADILIALPTSAIMKGKIDITIGDQRRTLQFSEEPFSTTIFAWYTGAFAQLTMEKCELESCVFLAYSLASKQPPPKPENLMKTSVFHHLHFILQNWRSGVDYAMAPPKKMLVFPLQSKYSSESTHYSKWLMVDDPNIKARDKIIVSVLKDVATALKLPVFIGTVNYADQGNVGIVPPDINNENSGPAGLVSNGAFEYTMNLEEIRDTDGYNLEGSIVRLHGNNLIPRTAFVNSEPECIGDFRVTQYGSPKKFRRCFLRSAVMITDKEREEEMFLSTRGSYMVKRLRNLNPTSLTPKEQRFLDHLVRQFNDLEDSHQEAVMKFSLQCKDIELMKKLVRESQRDYQVFSGPILKFFDTLPFEELEPTFRSQLEMHPSPLAPLLSISEILKGLGASNSDMIRRWCFKHTPAILRRISWEDFQRVYNSLDALSTLAANGGTSLILENFVLRLEDCCPSRDFLLKFVQTVHKGKSTLPNPKEVDEIILYSIHYLLQMPIPKLYSIDSPSKITLSCLRPEWQVQRRLTLLRRIPEGPQPMVRVSSDFLYHFGEILEVCSFVDQPTLYRRGLCLLLHTKELSKNKISESNIVSATKRLREEKILRKLVEKKELAPVKTFLRAIIGLYFSQVFKNATSPTSPVALEDLGNFGCDKAQCKACDQIRQFFQDQDTFEREIPMNGSEKTHVSSFLIACDLVDHTLLNRPSRVRLVKTQNLAKTQQSQNRVEKARKFLNMFGDERAIEQITGDKYFDILNALEGVPFRSNEDYRTSLGTLTRDMEIIYPEDEENEVIDLVDSQSEDEGDTAAQSGSKRKRNGGSGYRVSPAKSIRLTEADT